MGATAEPQSTAVTIPAFGNAQVPLKLRADRGVAAKPLSVILDFAGRSLEHKLPVDLVPPAEHLPDGLSLVSV